MQHCVPGDIFLFHKILTTEDMYSKAGFERNAFPRYFSTVFAVNFDCLPMHHPQIAVDFGALANTDLHSLTPEQLTQHTRRYNALKKRDIPCHALSCSEPRRHEERHEKNEDPTVRLVGIEC